MIINLELLKLQKLDLLNAIEQQTEEGIKDSMTGILNLLDEIQDTLEDEEKMEFRAQQNVKVLITVQDGSIQNVSADSELTYSIVEYDNDGINDEPVTVSEALSPDSYIKTGELFHVELFRGELSADEKRAKQLLKEINF